MHCQNNKTSLAFFWFRKILNSCINPLYKNKKICGFRLYFYFMAKTHSRLWRKITFDSHRLNQNLANVLLSKDK